jgi:hypothetical protein
MASLDVELNAGHLDVGPDARKKLRFLIRYYMKKPHPFTACVRDNTKRFGSEGAKRVCATLKDIGEGDNTHWRKGGRGSSVGAAIDDLISAANGNIDGLVAALLEQNDVVALSEGRPQLTTVPNVQIVKTGIEYPLASGPTTFTAEDLAAAVAAQSDPSVPSPRIWLGHSDDTRIHGERTRGVPSGEPAVGKVTDMRLAQDGHLIEGDLTGVPKWLANIMGSAFPSRSIEGRFNVETPTGKRHRLVINGLALLGVTWPGVMTLDDIATLYSEEGPKVEVIEATSDLPITIKASGERQVAGKVNVDDLRRAWYVANRSDKEKRNWWLRSIYVEPNELIVDADDGGSLFRQSFSIDGTKVVFGAPQRIKVQYVNASHGGIEAEPINENRVHVATFNETALDVNTSNVITIKLGGH